MPYVVRCVRCGSKLDPMDPSNLSVGMTGEACARCGRLMKREQQRKIAKFIKKAEARGLVVTFEVDGAGHTVMVAKPPKKEEEEEHGDEQRVENDRTGEIPAERVHGVDGD